MELAITVLLFIIATILFYRLVERRHKMILAQALVVVLVLGILVFGISSWRSRSSGNDFLANLTAKYERNQSALIVTFLADSTRQLASMKLGSYGDPRLREPIELSVPRHRIAFRVCSAASDTIDAFEITANTWSAGHSTRHQSRGLKADLILVPGACVTAVFDGTFTPLDSVKALAHPTWRNPDLNR